MYRMWSYTGGERRMSQIVLVDIQKLEEALVELKRLSDKVSYPFLSIKIVSAQLSLFSLIEELKKYRKVDEEEKKNE